MDTVGVSVSRQDVLATSDSSEAALASASETVRFAGYTAKQRTSGGAADAPHRRWGDDEALVAPSHEVRWTWKELAERVEALAARSLAFGLERGARIRAPGH
jgi:acyl-CoA synthetase (AMP-forming)/AMP-acid ligase II